jgi:hypothetical protein
MPLSKRAKPRRTRWAGAVVCAFVTAWFALPVLAGPTPPKLGTVARNSDRSNRGATAPGGGCKRAIDCDDDDACTVDQCNAGTCMNVPIPDCVRCTIDPGCDSIDLVFVLDTSGSMRDEAAALCSTIDYVVAEITDLNVDINVQILGISEIPRLGFDCVSDYVVNLFGADVPGPSSSCAFADGASPHESWGPATSIVADRYPWREGAVRVVVPIGDEGPCNGSLPDGCNDPGDDRDSIDNAISIANANNVFVSPIVGTGAEICVSTLASAIANATGGESLGTKSPELDFVDALMRIALGSCVQDYSCDDEKPCTVNDICRAGACIGTQIEGCQPCDVALDCEDRGACIDRSCIDNRCDWTINYDPLTVCCNPADRTLTSLSDGTPCTLDVCDGQTGDVAHPPASAGLVCDDGSVCSIDDRCDGEGGCSGTDLNTVSCQSDAGCRGQFCIDATGLCICSETPDILTSLVPDGDMPAICHLAGEVMQVNVEMGYSAFPVTEATFSFTYDPSVLQFVDIVPGGDADSSSPFVRAMTLVVDEVVGSVSYRVAVAVGEPGQRRPTVLAAARFTPLDSCTDGSICLVEPQVSDLRFKTESGDYIDATARCDGLFDITLPPVITCPVDVSVNSDAGVLSSVVEWDPPTATGECGGEVVIECTGLHSDQIDVSNLAFHGGRHPAGTSQYVCVATDPCGASSSCGWSIEVREMHMIEVTVELSPFIDAGPVERCMIFEFYTSPDIAPRPPEVIEVPVTFGRPFNLPGRADSMLFKLPAAGYVCGTARDPKHSLRGIADIEIVDRRYVITFAGDPLTKVDGTRPLLGNLADLEDMAPSIGVEDYAVFINQQGLTFDPPGTPCSSQAPNADIDGNGIVDFEDYAFISRNFLASTKVVCGIDFGELAKVRPGLTQITVRQLRALGMGDASRADLNHDGVINVDDMRAFERGVRPSSKQGRRTIK